MTLQEKRVLDLLASELGSVILCVSTRSSAESVVAATQGNLCSFKILLLLRKLSFLQSRKLALKGKLAHLPSNDRRLIFGNESRRFSWLFFKL